MFTFDSQTQVIGISVGKAFARSKAMKDLSVMEALMFQFRSYLVSALFVTGILSSQSILAQNIDDNFAEPPRHSEESLITNVADFFGATTETTGKLVRSIVSELGMPVAVIKGNEYSGAFVVGYKRGDGRLYQGGQSRPIYWAGATVGFDAGGDASKVYMLVYNATRSSDLYQTFAGVEGKLYFVAGGAIQLGAVRHEANDSNVVLVPIRAGVGWRGGVNVGSLSLSPSSNKWLPFNF